MNSPAHTLQAVYWAIDLPMRWGPCEGSLRAACPGGAAWRGLEGLDGCEGVTSSADLLVIDAAGPPPLHWAWPWGQGGGPRTLVLVANALPEHLMAWLTLGADMVAPASVELRELEARVRALLRPMRPARGPVPVHLSISPGALRWRNGRHMALAPREAELLAALTRRQGRPGTKMELLLDLGWRQEGRTPPFVELVVSRLRARLRQELGDDAARALETRRGAGYAWRSDCLPQLV